MARKPSGVGLGAEPIFNIVLVFWLLNQFADAGAMHTADRSSRDIIMLVVLMFHSCNLTRPIASQIGSDFRAE